MPDTFSVLGVWRVAQPAEIRSFGFLTPEAPDVVFHDSVSRSVSGPATLRRTRTEGQIRSL